MLITVHNRRPEKCGHPPFPPLWFRNTWSWKLSGKPRSPRVIRQSVNVAHRNMGEFQSSLRKLTNGKSELSVLRAL